MSRRAQRWAQRRASGAAGVSRPGARTSHRFLEAAGQDAKALLGAHGVRDRRLGGRAAAAERAHEDVAEEGLQRQDRGDLGQRNRRQIGGRLGKEAPAEHAVRVVCDERGALLAIGLLARAAHRAEHPSRVRPDPREKLLPVQRRADVRGGRERKQSRRERGLPAR